ncbi:MAG TPA: hypothetical protein VH877_27070 [Polyangia bacterium]|nr:hypothetical protein [Polyangia bacterium]
MMRKHLAQIIISGLAPLLLSACAPETGDPGAGVEGAAQLVESLVTSNALDPNGLNPNGLSPNGLSPNGLSPNSLAPAALAAIQDSTSIGNLSRMLLRYAVGCAFDQTQTFAFSWTDDYGVRHDELYRGHLGLAPAWASGPLSLSGQQIVSACLGALTNYYSVSVIVSVRSLQEPLKTLTGSPELKQYPAIEGAFFGNLFTDTPHLYSCYNAANVDHSRSAQRDCAAGHMELDPVTRQTSVASCGLIEILGSCKGRCQKINGAGQYYPACNDPVTGVSTKSVITTALP